MAKCTDDLLPDEGAQYSLNKLPVMCIINLQKATEGGRAENAA